jgi:hypothetical protein
MTTSQILTDATTGDLLIDALIQQGVYGDSNAVRPGESQSQVQGRVGVERVRSGLRRLAYRPIFVNQDLDPQTSSRPDLLACRDSKWVQLEIHYYLSTTYIDDTLNYGKTLCKDWLPGIPKCVVIVNKRYHTTTALRALEKNGILLVNGLMELNNEHLSKLRHK